MRYKQIDLDIYVNLTHVWSTCHLVNVFVAPFAPFLGYCYVVVFTLEVVVSATGGADVGWLLGTPWCALW